MFQKDLNQAKKGDQTRELGSKWSPAKSTALNSYGKESTTTAPTSK